MRCYIIDDDQPSIDIIVGHIIKTPALTLVGSSKNPLQAKKSILNGDISMCILFMGIEMEQTNGIDLASELKNHTDIIFTSKSSLYGSQAFDLSAKDYLLKPISYERFSQGIEKIKQDSSSKNIFVQSEKKGKWFKINCDKILYIESRLNNLIIYSEDQNPISTSLSINEFKDKICPYPFIAQIHRSYLVNKTKIFHIENKKVTLVNKKELPISKSFYRNIINNL